MDQWRDAWLCIVIWAVTKLRAVTRLRAVESHSLRTYLLPAQAGYPVAHPASSALFRQGLVESEDGGSAGYFQAVLRPSGHARLRLYGNHNEGRHVAAVAQFHRRGERRSGESNYHRTDDGGGC